MKRTIARKVSFARRLRANQSFPERKLGRALREKIKGYRLYSQKPCHGWILDFFYDKAKLCIEVDGEAYHRNRQKQDAFRDLTLSKYGIKTLRFSAKEVFNNLPAVLVIIESFLKKRLKT